MMALGVGMFVVLTLVMGLIQVAIFKSFPKFIRYFFSYNLFMGMVVNFLLSSTILFFTGVGNLVGFLNLAGSVLFGIWLGFYKNYHGINKIEWEPYRKKILKLVPLTIFWYPVINAENDENHWLF